MSELRLEFPKANMRQAEAMHVAETSGCRELLLDGAIRSGKTQAACWQLALDAIEHGGTYVVGRNTYRELEDTTKKAMLRGDGGLPPAIPPELIIEERVVDNQVTIRSREGKAEILFRSMETPEVAQDKVRNITMNGFLIDQAEELKDPAFAKWSRTMRSRLSDPRGPRRGYYISNPAAETHWLYEKFIEESTRVRRTAYVHFVLTDNAENLDPEYLEDMLATEHDDPEFFSRFVMGEWGSFEGKRFKCFNPAIHVVDPFDVPVEWEITEGGDYGWENPTCWLWHAVAHCGHEFFCAEHYANHMAVPEHVQRIRETRETYRLWPSMSWLDPSAWARQNEYESIAARFQEHGLVVAKAENERIGGWDRLDSLLKEDIRFLDRDDKPYCTCPAGPGPRLRLMDGRAPWLRKQLPGLERKEGTDDVEKVNDHAPDAARYIVMSRPFKPVKPEPEESDRHVRYLRQLKERADEPDPTNLYVGG